VRVVLLVLLVLLLLLAPSSVVELLSLLRRLPSGSVVLRVLVPRARLAWMLRRFPWSASMAVWQLALIHYFDAERNCCYCCWRFPRC